MREKERENGRESDTANGNYIESVGDRERWGASDNALYKVLEKEMKINGYGDREIERETQLSSRGC